MGAVSLALLPIVLRARQIKPPQGFVIVAVLAAIAPIAVVFGRI
jgi:hypothetical protein